MWIKTSFRQVVTGICLVTATAPAFAASTVTVTSAGNNAYVLRGSGFTSATIVDVAISYDSTALSNPRVTGGSLANNGMTAANVTAPGTVQLSIIGNGAMTGSGPLATISFDRTGSSAGGVTAVKGNIVEGDGKHIPVAVTIASQSDVATALSATTSTTSGTSSTESPSGTTTSSTTDGTTTASSNGAGNETRGTSGQIVLGGTVTLPPDPLQKEETAKEQDSPSRHPDHEQNAEEHRVQAPEVTPQAQPTPQEKVAQQPASTKPEVASVVMLRSALERFALFEGERTMQSLIALLNQPQGSVITQEPAVAISDGKGSVKLLVKVPSDKAPNFAFNAARALSVMVTDGGWLLEAQPEKGALQASVTVLSASTIQDLPLVVAPAADVDLDRSGQVTAADFTLFLKERGKEGAPHFDLNADGKRDYIDDYIFTANYVAAAGKGNNKKGPAKEPQGKPVAVAASGK